MENEMSWTQTRGDVIPLEHLGLRGAPYVIFTHRGGQNKVTLPFLSPSWAGG